MAQYLILIYESEEAYLGATPEVLRDVAAAHDPIRRADTHPWSNDARRQRFAANRDRDVGAR